MGHSYSIVVECQSFSNSFLKNQQQQQQQLEHSSSTITSNNQLKSNFSNDMIGDDKTCPVDHGKSSSSSSSSSALPNNHPKIGDGTSPDKCPIDHNSREKLLLVAKQQQEAAQQAPPSNNSKSTSSSSAAPPPSKSKPKPEVYNVYSQKYVELKIIDKLAYSRLHLYLNSILLFCNFFFVIFFFFEKKQN